MGRHSKKQLGQYKKKRRKSLRKEKERKREDEYLRTPDINDGAEAYTGQTGFTQI